MGHAASLNPGGLNQGGLKSPDSAEEPNTGHNSNMVTCYFCSLSSCCMCKVLAKRDTTVISLLVWCAWNQHMNSIICLLGTGRQIYRGWTSVTANKTQNMCLNCKMWLNSKKWRGKKTILNRAALLFREGKVENGVGDIYRRRHQHIRFKIALCSEWKVKLGNEL